MMPLSALRGLLLLYCLVLVTQRKLSEEKDMSSSDCDDDTRSRCQKVYRPITDNFFKLYQNPEYWSENTNVLFSPISLMAVVAMFSLGTKADTQAQIMKCLGLSHRQLPRNLIQQCLQCLPYVQHQPDDELQLTASSHLFIGNNLKLKHRVLKNLKLYHAERTSMNFTDTEQAVQQLSNYAEKDTQREIMGFIKEHNKDANLVLLNHMNFRGKLNDEFQTVSVADENFYVDENTTIQVPTLYSWGRFYLERDELLSCWVLVQFYVGNITAFFLLPDRGMMQRMTEKLTAEHLENIRKFIDIKIYHLRFPKLTSISINDLNTFLKKSNITKFFEDENNFWVSKIQAPKTFPELLQQVVLTMSENGTEFAATADTPVEYSYRDLTVRFNRPFVVVISVWNDFNANIPLFMGKVVNPKNISSSIPIPRPLPPSHVPTAQPPSRVPTAQPPSHVPTTQPPGRVPTAQPPGRVPTAQPPGRVPTAQPPSRVPTPQQ